MTEVAYRAGAVAILGRPNAGKSTLLNHFLGELSVGLTRKIGNAVSVSFALHYQTDEIKHDNRSKNIRWGGLTIQKLF